jgi:hypothetical protein
MNFVIEIDSANYVPISFKDRYLFDTYDIIMSYLKTKLSPADLERLLKPSLEAGGKIKWYGAFTDKLFRISDISEQAATKVKVEFHSFLKRVQQVSDPLMQSRDSDSREWGELLSQLFREDKIILVGSDSGKWAMLWGWDFRNREENRLPVINFPKENEQPPQQIEEGQGSSRPFTQPVSNPREDFDTTNDKGHVIFNSKSVDPTNLAQSEANTGCIGRIVRFLRWMSYRFWGLIWLLIYTMVVILLTRYFYQPIPSDCCIKLKQAREELEILDQRIRERCDSTSSGQ